MDTGNQIQDIVRNQLKSGNPEATSIHYKRLKEAGYSDAECINMIGMCIVTEMHNLLLSRQPFDLQRYSRMLSKLPAEPVSVYDNLTYSEIIKQRR